MTRANLNSQTILYPDELIMKTSRNVMYCNIRKKFQKKKKPRTVISLIGMISLEFQRQKSLEGNGSRTEDWRTRRCSIRSTENFHRDVYVLYK